MKLKTKELTTCALFAALIAIGAFIKVDIPLPMYTMHFTFQWFFVLMAGFLLGAKLATVSVIVYLSIGLVGVPVFSAGVDLHTFSDQDLDSYLVLYWQHLSLVLLQKK